MTDKTNVTENAVHWSLKLQCDKTTEIAIFRQIFFPIKNSRNRKTQISANVYTSSQFH